MVVIDVDTGVDGGDDNGDDNIVQKQISRSLFMDLQECLEILCWICVWKK